MKRKALKGHLLMLWIAGKVIALSKSCSINLAAIVGDSNTKDDGAWDGGEVVGFNWSATNQSVDSADEEVSNDYVFDELFDLMIAGEPVKITFGRPTNATDGGVPEAGWTEPTTSGYQGNALITALDRTGDKGSNASISINLQGVGELKKLKTKE